MSTLDHLTEGRIGWNVVTGYLDSAAKGMGEKGQRGHDDRYAVAEDYMSVVYKLWEGSWADDAVVADVKTGVFTRPDRVRRVRHDGSHYKLDALHLSEPSPRYACLVSGGHLACGARLRGPSRRMRVHVRSLEKGDRAPGRRDPETCGGGRARSGGRFSCSP